MINHIVHIYVIIYIMRPTIMYNSYMLIKVILKKNRFGVL